MSTPASQEQYDNNRAIGTAVLFSSPWIIGVTLHHEYQVLSHNPNIWEALFAMGLPVLAVLTALHILTHVSAENRRILQVHSSQEQSRKRE